LAGWLAYSHEVGPLGSVGGDSGGTDRPDSGAAAGPAASDDPGAASGGGGGPDPGVAAGTAAAAATREDPSPARIDARLGEASDHLDGAGALATDGDLDGAERRLDDADAAMAAAETIATDRDGTGEADVGDRLDSLRSRREAVAATCEALRTARKHLDTAVAERERAEAALGRDRREVRVACDRALDALDAADDAVGERDLPVAAALATERDRVQSVLERTRRGSGA